MPSRKKAAVAPPRRLKAKRPAALVLAVPTQGLLLLAWGLALIAPLGGLLGVLYASQPSPACQRFGQTCLWLAAAGLLAGVIAAGLIILLPLIAADPAGLGVYD